MLLIDSLAEEQIQSAIRRGEFQNLPGKGKPLDLDDDIWIPDELRVAYRVLRNAGCLPPTLMLRHEIHELESLLPHVDVDNEEQIVRRRLCLLQTQLAMHGREINLLSQEEGYRVKLLQRMVGEDGKLKQAAKNTNTIG